MATKRMDQKIVAQIERWLQGWATGQYGSQLTWDKLATYSGFSRQSLSANRAISRAYRSTKIAIKRGFLRENVEPHLQQHEEQISRLRDRIEELEVQHDAWTSLWERWRYNARQQGWDVSLLDKDMPKPLHRKRPRH